MAAATPAKRGEEKEELKEELRTPRPGGGARSPRSGGSSPRTPASTSPKERRRSYEVSFFKAKGASKADIKRRHEMFGYDPLDKAIYEEREHLARSLGLLNGPSSPGAPSPPRGSAAHEEGQTRLLREYDANVRELLRDHLMTMAASGIVFNHVFTTPKLGFSILIARYGAMGRMFVEVEETYGSCQEKRLKPTDELIAIDGEVIDAPAADKPLRALALIKKKIAKAGRPVKLTFIPVWKSTTGLGGPDQTSEFSSSVKSKSIRLIFGRIDCSRRVLEAQQKASRRNGRIRAH